MRTEFGDELWQLAHAMQRLTILAHQRPQVTRDYTGTEEFCVDCNCEVTAGDLLCERCDDIRQQTEQALAKGGGE
jgi:hypothetical protein